MIESLVVIDGRWARMGMALLAVALMTTLPSPSLLGTSIPSTPAAPTTSSEVLGAGQSAHSETLPSAPTASSEPIPASLEAAISATLGEAYLIAPGLGGALEADNPRQSLEARFSAEGIGVRPIEGQWSFDLSLARYGRQDQLLSVSTSSPLALGARVEYTREHFTEWYENRPQGIEQGFFLASPPPGDGLVELEFIRSENLSADLSPDARSVLLSDPQGNVVLRYQDLVAYDAGGQQLSARLELGSGTISLLVDDREAAYPITIDPLVVTEQAHLFASDGAAGDFFGRSVAVAGDTALVGAYTVGGGSAGSAYVFVRSGTTWTEQAHLFASDGAAGDNFGRSVALAGDTALVGAYFDDTAGGGDAGSAHVFVRSGTTWTEQAHLLASDGAEADFFGVSVALAGDTALVSAQGDDTAAGVQAGSAYVFVRNGTTWTEQAHLFASDGAASDFFGLSVALAGDTALVGAVGDDTTAGGGAGSAYVFVRSGTSWTEQAHLFASDGAADDFVGESVALADDTALVGAGGDDTAGGVGAGSAYVFVRSGTIWTEQAHLFASDGAAGDRFGFSVALDGDTALVGAMLDDTAGGFDAGSAYVFVRSGTTWAEQAHLFAFDGAEADNFGVSVALAGDTALVGAFSDDTAGGVDAGSAYAFEISAAQSGADLGVTKTDSPDPVTVGAPLTYTVTVTNAGPDTATEVTLTDTLPAGVTFVSATPSQGTCSGTATVTCSLGTLGSGAMATVTIVVTPTAPGDITNTASVSAATTDPSLANNTATAVTTVNAASSCTITGTEGNDVLTGTSGDDVICGMGGNDTMSGLGGDDTLLGGNGNDTLTGGAGNDTVNGQAGSDTAGYAAAPAGVTVDLTARTATGDGTDTISGVENITGSGFADTLNGNAGANRVTAAGGGDTVNGRSGNDTLNGHGGGDILNGQGGNDTLNGQGGNDSLNGGVGTDTLTGGTGTDSCLNGETVTTCE